MAEQLFTQANLILLITSFLGAIGFALVFQSSIRHLLLDGVAGLAAEAVYLLAGAGGCSDFLCAFLSALSVTLLAEVLARIRKAPTIVFLLPGIVPIVPGSSLYYMMSALVFRTYDSAVTYGRATLYISVGIVTGIIVVSVLFSIGVQIVSTLKKNARRKAGPQQ